MADITLLSLFGKFLQAIKPTQQDFRKELNKEAIHYLEESINSLKSQIALVDAKVEIEFNKKYGQALVALQEKGISNLTFSQIADTLRKKFLDHFVDLKDLNIQTGHVIANLTIASKQKAQTELFEGFTGPVSEYSQVQLTPENLDKISKGIALVAAYTGALEELDKIQDRKSLIKFLKTAPTFKQYAKTASLTTLEDIKNAISSAYEAKGKSKGYAELTDQLFRSNINNIEIDTAINFARKITATDSKVAVTFEVQAVNGFKGSIAAGIKNAFTLMLQNFIETGEFSEVVDKALTKALKDTLTREQFLELFPNSSGSKTLEKTIVDIIASNIKFGKSSPYSAASKTPSKNISNKIPISFKGLKLKPPRVKQRPITAPVKPHQLNLSNLQNIINSLLHQRIRQNMGTGSSRNILNYRTGRFAESVKVENMSQGRQGMITAYYNYMKYPYATFSAGGRQEFPRSRDPKLLISKSIQEIMQEQMITRMRAVLV